MAGQPSTPTNLFLQTSNMQNYLSWNQSTGATSYSVLRSLDNVNFTTIATLSGVPLLPQYLDTSVSIGVQYWYGVVATNANGSSGVAQPTSQSISSLVPAPTSEMSLATLRRHAQEKADRVNSNFVSLSEWNTFLTLSLYELYDILIDTYQNYNVAVPIQFSTNGQQYLFPLPDGIITFTNRITNTVFAAPPFYRLLGMDLSLNTANNAYVTLGKFPFTERNDYVYPNAAGTIYGVYNMRYQLVGSNLMVIPTPTANQILSIWYIPRLPELMQDTDLTTLGISGWMAFVINRAAKYALDKEESNTDKLDAEILYLKGRIEESAIDRDAGLPNTISRVRGFNGINGRDGNSWGGTPSAGWLIASFNVLPHMSTMYSTHQLLANPIHLSNFISSMTFFGAIFSYFFYLVLSQHGCTISFSNAFGSIRGCLTSLRQTIVDIVFHSAKKKMSRIDAFPIVATMADDQSFGDSAIVKFPAYPMSTSRFARKALSGSSFFSLIDDSHSSIPCVVQLAKPFPAIVRPLFVSKFPKTFVQRNRGIVPVHREAPYHYK